MSSGLAEAQASRFRGSHVQFLLSTAHPRARDYAQVLEFAGVGMSNFKPFAVKPVQVLCVEQPLGAGNPVPGEFPGELGAELPSVALHPPTERPLGSWTMGAVRP
ncbi:hypothetical protein KIL84_005884 [Mauremys mutica]|uniref:Uncharacterized protein n=1 Tax=Mauremys mutica TaxID=74926 RepID=A0A9D4B455_9SAUR|nr:hypothetical protein KIL84_005884 [Mauremys mutica]